MKNSLYVHLQYLNLKFKFFLTVYYIRIQAVGGSITHKTNAANGGDDMNERERYIKIKVCGLFTFEFKRKWGRKKSE